MEHVKKHFQEEAEIFDSLIKTLIPNYEDMISSIVKPLPFHEKEKIKVLDIGCGTGNISFIVKEKFPRANLTCLDLSENMIRQTMTKLDVYENVEYVVSDLRDLKYENQFDAILSSLAIHHISREEQRLLYSKILSALKKGGVFFNADILKSDNKYLNQVYMDTWTNFMSKNYSAEEIEKLWLSKHQKEDNPQPLTDHLRWLKEAGFLDVDVIWKYYYFGVYGGKK